MAAYKFLTNAPTTKLIRTGEFEELHILEYGVPALSLKGCIVETPTSGSVITTYTSLFSVVGNRLSLCVKPSGSVTWTNAGTIQAYIVWEVLPATNPKTYVRCTEIRTFTADKTNRKRSYRIGWVNTLGGIDYYTFYGSETMNAAAQQATIQKELPYPLVKTDRGEKVLSSVYSEEISIYSDFLSEIQTVWLSELLSSPEAWRVDSSGNNIPIVILTQKQVLKADGMIQYALTFRDANQRVTQDG